MGQALLLMKMSQVGIDVENTGHASQRTVIPPTVGCDAHSARWCSCPRVAWDKTTTWLLSLSQGSQLAEKKAVIETQIPTATLPHLLGRKSQALLIGFQGLEPPTPKYLTFFPHTHAGGSGKSPLFMLPNY